MTSIMSLLYSSALIGSFLQFLTLLKKWSSFVLLPSLLSLFLTIAMSSLLSKLLISISFGFFFLEFYFVLLFGTHSFIFSFCYTFWIVSMNWVKQLPLPGLQVCPYLQGILVSIPCVDCVYQMTWARVCVTRGSPRTATPMSVWPAGRTWVGHRMGSILRVHKQWCSPSASNLGESPRSCPSILLIEFPFHLV